MGLARHCSNRGADCYHLEVNGLNQLLSWYLRLSFADNPRITVSLETRNYLVCSAALPNAANVHMGLKHNLQVLKSSIYLVHNYRMTIFHVVSGAEHEWELIKCVVYSLCKGFFKQENT